MLKSGLGFGMMRLPVRNENPTGFDYDELNRMEVVKAEKWLIKNSF